MDLHVTLAAGPGVRLPGGGTTEELVVTSAHLLSGEQLSEQLSRCTGADHFLVAGTPLRELDPGIPPLASGAVIVAATSGHMNTQPHPRSNLFFLVRSGPDAGKSVPLSRGTYTIGRSAAAITIHDPELSRIHAVLTVTNDALTLRDRSSANGVWVDGAKVGRTAVTTESDIRIGSSRCALVLADTPVEPPVAVDLDEPCAISVPPPPDGNRLLIFTAFLPLVLGIVLAVTTGMWFFLAFSALSAVTGLVPLINGRRKRRAFDAAVAGAAATDSERRRRAAPDAGGLTLATLRPGKPSLGQPTPAFSGGRYVRLGVANQPANVEVRPKPPEWQAPLISGMPVLVPLTEPGNGEPLNVNFRGPQQTLTGVAHLLLLQLSALHHAGEILCHGSVAELPLAARFLPRVTLVAHPERFTELLATGQYSSVVLFGTEPPADVAGLRFYCFSSSMRPDSGQWAVDYFSPQPVLQTPGGLIRFDPDYVRAETFESLARVIGARTNPEAMDMAEPSVPETVVVADLIACASTDIAQRWRAGSDGARLRTGIGSTAAGPLAFDLVGDGPHLLIAGTTGSGKSEFLRTLILGLALNYSPAGLNFLFIDFKGGSGLGGLVSLPHVAGMLTDLSATEVSRALISLKAEVKRREALFADADAADYLEYLQRTSSKLPRLVTVIDEFRMLSEEVPGSVNELMRIATLGRSLGMHLVLATQRPQGAVTSDIRANITASVALRMQSAMESQDVLESAVASTIPVNLPGRGYLRVASGQPIEFQTATTAPGTGSSSPSITSIIPFLMQGARPDAHPGWAEHPTTRRAARTTGDLQALVASVGSAAQTVPLPPLREPVRPPLPPRTARDTAVQADFPQLGLLDIPEGQKQRPLVWHPEYHSHLALLGQPGSGLRSVLTHAAAEHLRCMPDRHLYLLDGDTSLRPVMQAPQIGAYVTGSEVKRAARVLQRIAALVIERLNTAPELLKTAAPLTLFVTGWGRWASSFRSGRFAWAEDALQDIVRDGEAAGITLVIAGERELIASRVFPTVPNRLYLPLGASSESLLSWPKLPAIDALPGRAFAQGRISAEQDAVAQLIMETGPVPSVQPARSPFPVAALPRVVSDEELEPAPSGSRTVRIPVGVGGDDLAPVHLPTPPRMAALVVGAAGTGKSHTLDLIEKQAPPTISCLRPGKNEDHADFWKRATQHGDAANCLLLVDDADQLPRDTHQHLAGMLAAGARAVFTCAPSPSLAAIPSLAALRFNPLGIILGPRSPTDGEVFGLRLDVDGTPPPGRGILVDARRSVEIQVALCGENVSDTHFRGFTG